MIKHLKINSNFNEFESTRQIKRGAILSYVAIAVNILAGLLYTPWMVQQIGQDNYGLYTLATSLISMFLIDFGLSAAVSRFVSRYNAEGDQDSVNNVLGLTYKIYLLIDFVILFVLIIVYLNLDLIYNKLTPNELSAFRVVYIIAAAFSILSFPFTTLNGILTSYEKFAELKICDIFNRISSVLFIIFALLNEYGLYALVTANAISGIATILLKLIIIKRKTSVKANLNFKSKVMVREIFSFSIWSAIVSIAQRFIFNITPSILGSVSGAASIAVFGIASYLEGYVYTIASAINGLFLPKVTRIVIKDNASANLLQLMIKIGRIQLSIIGIITIGFITIGKDFVILWMGEEYILSYYNTIFLILPSLFYLPQQIGNTAIVALNKVKLQAYVFIVMAIVNMLFSIVLSYFWGSLGASLSICISYFIRNVGMNVIYHKSLKINIFIFFKECYIRLLLPLLSTLVIGLGTNFIFSGVSWFNLILKGSIIVVTYILLMWIKGFNQYEKDLVKETILQLTSKLKGGFKYRDND